MKKLALMTALALVLLGLGSPERSSTNHTDKCDHE